MSNLLRAIPEFKIPYELIHKRINKYKYSKTIVQAIIEQTRNDSFDYMKDGIPFGDFFVETVDMQLIIAYIKARKVKANTLLRELSTISGAFTHAYKYFTEFEDGLETPSRNFPETRSPSQTTVEEPSSMKNKH